MTSRTLDASACRDVALLVAIENGALDCTASATQRTHDTVAVSLVVRLGTRRRAAGCTFKDPTRDAVAEWAADVVLDPMGVRT
jgi:alkylhydroperoxidase family enzyme